RGNFPRDSFIVASAGPPRNGVTTTIELTGRRFPCCAPRAPAIVEHTTRTSAWARSVHSDGYFPCGFRETRIGWVMSPNEERWAHEVPRAVCTGALPRGLARVSAVCDSTVPGREAHRGERSAG